jgi:hypothetical protein
MTTTLTVPAPQLRQALQTASAFMCDDDTFSTLNGVHLAPDGDPAGDRVAFTATNLFVASHETLKISGEAFEATIPGRVVTALIAVLAPIDVEDDNDPHFGPVPPVEPFDLATFALADDGKQMTVRLVGVNTIEIGFESPSMKFPNIPLIFDQAETAAQQLAGLHFDPGQLGAVLDAVRGRDDGEPLKVVGAANGKPMLVRRGEAFKALVMSVKVPND